ncbi:2OG-Fe(II) oxygenase [Stenotrophomonas acidaminiphila]|uniref:2OG-Fe(II) oxygenase n=1 Tax=Stenotrophomonas acidaminiphila TaxID=128780 RepID=UPI0028A589B7|nr:2OG-Fe(II) oxygenase [Stenotrophomonas acidaminiphila]
MQQKVHINDSDMERAVMGILPEVVSRTPAQKFRCMPRPSEPAPWFHAATADNPNFSFDTVAGRRLVLCFFGDMQAAPLQSLLSGMQAVLAQIERSQYAFFGVGTARNDAQVKLFKQQVPEGYLFLDRDRAVSELYGAAPIDGRDASIRVVSFVLDERLRVAGVIPWTGDSVHHARDLLSALRALPEEIPETSAPVLIIPRIFEPELCQRLIGYYEQHGGKKSGFMRDVDGQTKLIHDPRHKRRKDRVVEDEQLRLACLHRIHDRLVPEIEKAFQFRATRIERYIVACYEAENAGHFRAHRDNTTAGTAHRRFAVSLNLNTGDYEGGVLRFPEFGRRLYQPPLGGALVFSCSLLHEATPVTLGVRYAFLPFLYDEFSAALRQANR